jgi:hypothetical protein
MTFRKLHSQLTTNHWTDKIKSYTVSVYMCCATLMIRDCQLFFYKKRRHEPCERELYGQHFVDVCRACVCVHWTDIVKEVFYSRSFVSMLRYTFMACCFSTDVTLQISAERCSCYVACSQFPPVFVWFSELRPTHGIKLPSLTSVRCIKGSSSLCWLFPLAISVEGWKWYANHCSEHARVINSYVLDPTTCLVQL